jgi:hypothetical protein
MAAWHVDNDCNAALMRLNDALCNWERSTGRGCHLILIPHNQEEEIFFSESGKPISPDMGFTAEVMLDAALSMRKRNGEHLGTGTGTGF